MSREPAFKMHHRLLRFDLHSLTARLALTLLAIAIGTVLLIGLPTAWLVRTQLEQQAWARLEQAAPLNSACCTTCSSIRARSCPPR